MNDGQGRPDAGAAIAGAARLAAASGRLRLVVDSGRSSIGTAAARSTPAVRPVPPATRADVGVAGLQAMFDALPVADTRRRDTLQAALNGLLGDHLQRCGHPLALALQLRRGGVAVDSRALGEPPRRLLLLVHGLCLSDLGWQRDGHDHGELLGRALGATAIYARYNSGLRLATNGRALADALEALVQGWTAPPLALMIVGHGMGGLVARSACAHAAQSGQRWLGQLSKMVFIGTPHQGAPLQRGGDWLHRVLALSPGGMPFGRLSRLCSDGIADLREGRLPAADGRGVLPLPAGVACHAIAGTLGRSAAGLRGDGLVSVASALGRHRRSALDLGLPSAHCWLGHGLAHLDLLSDPAVYRRLLAWLGD